MTRFRSRRVPYALPSAGRAPVRIWEASTPYGDVEMQQAQAPLRVVVAGHGIPTVELIAVDVAPATPAMRTFGEIAFPARLTIDGVVGSVAQPLARRWSPMLTRASRRIDAVVGTRVWSMRSTGIAGRIVVERDGVLVARSSSSFLRHELSPQCTPEDLAVAVALSPLRTGLSVIVNLV